MFLSLFIFRCYKCPSCGEYLHSHNALQKHLISLCSSYIRSVGVAPLAPAAVITSGSENHKITTPITASVLSANIKPEPSEIPTGGNDITRRPPSADDDTSHDLSPSRATTGQDHEVVMQPKSEPHINLSDIPIRNNDNNIMNKETSGSSNTETTDISTIDFGLDLTMVKKTSQPFTIS